MDRRRVAEVLAGARRFAVVHGEARRTLDRLPPACADLVATDPPYSSGGAFRGDRVAPTGAKYEQTTVKKKRPDFSGDNRDQRSFLAWASLWMAEALRVTKPGGVICVFSDWRQLPTMTDAIQAGGWVWRGIVPWNKSEGSRPQRGRFRQQAEFVVWGTNGPRSTVDTLARDVGVLPGWFEGYVRPEDKHHQAGKPVEVCREIVRVAPRGGLVLDLFAGGGSMLVAALLEGRRALGVELLAPNVETTIARCAEVAPELRARVRQVA